MSVERTAIQTAWRRCGWLTAAALVLWLALAVPAWSNAGRYGLIGLSTAALLCLVPGWIMFWVAASYGKAGSEGSLVILGATALRIVFVGLGVIVILMSYPRLGFRAFFVWLLVFYLALLTVETCLVLLRSASRNGQPRVGGA